jgi:hypothetical protein
MSKKYVSENRKNGIVLRDIEECDNPIAIIKECKRVNDYKDVIGIQTKKSFEEFFIELGKKVAKSTEITDLPMDDDFLSLVAKVVLDNEIPNEYFIETRISFNDHKVYIIKTEDR